MTDPTPRDEPAANEQPAALPSETIELEIAALEAALPPPPPADSSPPSAGVILSEAKDPQVPVRGLYQDDEDPSADASG